MKLHVFMAAWRGKILGWIYASDIQGAEETARLAFGRKVRVF